MNNDLISREALQEEHSKECIHNCYYCQHFKWSKKKACSYCDVIDNAPTVEAVDFEYHDKLIKQAYKKGKDIRPQGEWVGIHEYLNHLEEETGERYEVSSIYDGSSFCNQCWGMQDERSFFCPFCGAMMRKVVQNENDN